MKITLPDRSGRYAEDLLSRLCYNQLRLGARSDLPFDSLYTAEKPDHTIFAQVAKKVLRAHYRF
jgi:hypothetical protein